MKRILIIVGTGLLLLILFAPAASAFGVKDVIRMTEDEIPDSLIITKIEYSGKTFHLDADDMRKLREAGVSDEVVSAMLRTEGQDRDYGRDYYYHPYVRPYPRLFLGFGYHSYRGYPGYPGYHVPYRTGYGYWGYRYPRYGSHYRPYSSQPYSGNYGSSRYRGSYGSRQPSTGSSGTQHRRR